MFKRLRRNRSSTSLRNLLQETHLLPQDLVPPFFVIEGQNKKQPILSMPPHHRLSIDNLIKKAEDLHRKGIQAIAIFPSISPSLRTLEGKESYNEEGLIPKAIRCIKKAIPSLCLITDIALDPYTSHGHDGIVNSQGVVDNDQTLDMLKKQALAHAKAGSDILAPSDMMDGHTLVLRQHLDQNGFKDVKLLSYTAKFASSFYAPFRDAIQTTLQFGDKKSYQLNPANQLEALLEAKTDEEEGADLLLIKPALAYLDVLAKVAAQTHLPVGAYHVSGEYAMVMAAANQGLLDKEAVFYEMLLSIKRAGARFIFSYATEYVLPMISAF